MSRNTYLEIHESKDVTFTDLRTLNAELGSHLGVSALLDFNQVPSGSGFIMVGAKGKILFMNREDGEYSDSANVFDFWDDALFSVMAKHPAIGELVLAISNDDHNEELWLLTPAHAHRTKPAF